MNDEDLDLALQPIPPLVALQLMGEKTFGATDIYGPMTSNDFLNDPNLQNPDNRIRPAAALNFPATTKDKTFYENRMRRLLCFAVYYSACALLSVSKDAQMDKKPDTTTGRINDNLQGVGTPIEADHTVPQREIITVEKSRQTSITEWTGGSNQESLMILSVSLIPILALLILPIAAKHVITPKEQLINEEQYELVTTKRTV